MFTPLKKFLFALAVFVPSALTLPAQAKTVEYTFDIAYKTINITGEPVQAMSVGGSIPAPVIEATVGDTLRATFNNKMDVPSSIHWHGVLLPQDQDGVPYLTMPPIRPGTSFTYEYPVIHHGTYWYHSHTGLQEQRGVYGAIVFHPQDGEPVKTDHDIVVVLSDWTNENPNQVMHNLKKSDDYYALKKGSVQSWLKVFQHGRQAIANRIRGAWMRMGPMDISDVGYDAFLVNGQQARQFAHIKGGDKVRLRVVNAAASSYFNVEFAGGPLTILSADGVDVEPLEVNRQRLAIAETFDLAVTVPVGGAWEFRATAEDGTGHSSLLLGTGPRRDAPEQPRPNPYLMDHSAHEAMAETAPMGHAGMEHAGMGHAGMDHAGAAQGQMREYEQLRALVDTSYQNKRSEWGEGTLREITLELTGDMERYAWSFNNKVFSEDSTILIRKGEILRLILKNKTMMHHPIHLHGHFFRVLNGQGAQAPLKHTVNVPMLQTVTIEFLANEEKDWLFHCHNLYHMKSGMTRVVSYAESTQATPQSLRPMFADRDWFGFADLGGQSNFTHGNLRTENTRNAFNLEYEWDYEDEYEAELVYERYIDKYLQLYIGAEVEQEKEGTKKSRHEIGILGLRYLLPLMIEASLRLDSDGDARLGLSSDLQLTDRLSLDWDINTDDEYRVQLEYELSRQLVIVGGVDDRFDWGAGMEWRF